MLVNITGNRCIGCAKFTQYYCISHSGEFQRIDCGFCGQQQRTTRPGNRCGKYRERGNVVGVYPLNQDTQDSA